MSSETIKEISVERIDLIGSTFVIKVKNEDGSSHLVDLSQFKILNISKCWAGFHVGGTTHDGTIIHYNWPNHVVLQGE